MTRDRNRTAAALPCRRADVPFKEFGPQEGMLLDLVNGEYYGLAGAALAIWKRLDGRTTREAISTQVAAAFGGPEARVTKDLDAFLRQLRSAGLLAEPGTTADPVPSPRRARAAAAQAYRAPRLEKRGNLKYLGQLD
jgi:hypothetical protein